MLQQVKLSKNALLERKRERESYIVESKVSPRGILDRIGAEGLEIRLRLHHPSAPVHRVSIIERRLAAKMRKMSEVANL